MIINKLTTPKNIPINRQVITFFNIVASGIESPIITIIKAIAVPRGIPFAKPMKRGTEEQEQKGVIPPNKAARK